MFKSADTCIDSCGFHTAVSQNICQIDNIVIIFIVKIKPKPDYPLKTLYPRAFQTGLNRLIYYDFTTVE